LTLLCSLTILVQERRSARGAAHVKVKLLLQDEAAAEEPRNRGRETVADGERRKERITTNEKVFLRFHQNLFKR